MWEEHSISPEHKYRLRDVMCYCEDYKTGPISKTLKIELFPRNWRTVLNVFWNLQMLKEVKNIILISMCRH